MNVKQLLKTTRNFAFLWIALGALSAPALAQTGLDEPFQGPYKAALNGKTVAYVPGAMNLELTEGWYAVLKKELEPQGIKVEVRDPNWSTVAGAQAITALITEKPAVIIAHNWRHRILAIDE